MANVPAAMTTMVELVTSFLDGQVTLDELGRNLVVQVRTSGLAVSVNGGRDAHDRRRGA